MSKVVPKGRYIYKNKAGKGYQFSALLFMTVNIIQQFLPKLYFRYGSS